MSETRQKPPRTEPDLRVLQANERTLLAWLRTALALLAFGFVISRISLWMRISGFGEDASWSRWLGVAFLALGTACSPIATARYLRVRASILAGEPFVPDSSTLVFLSLSLMTLGAALLLFVATR